jgi:lysophospholipase
MSRRRAILALVLCLAACGGPDSRAPFTDSRIPPNLGPADWPPDGWAWGLIQVGEAPPQRYGVAAPAAPPRAQVLILPGYGQAAEDEFHLARTLIAAGDQVWVLDGAGQGGSGRLGGPRDLGQITSFDSDLEAIERLDSLAIRPKTPLILIADGTAGVVALRRLRLGAPGVAGAVLRGPTVQAPGGATDTDWTAQWAMRLGLSGLRAAHAAGWSRDGPELGAGLNAATQHAWRLANPDLRMGGPSLGWLAAFSRLRAEVAAGGPRAISQPIMILGSSADTRADRAWRDALCRAIAGCVQAETNNQTASEQRILTFIGAVVGRDAAPPALAGRPRPFQSPRLPLALTQRRRRSPGRIHVHAPRL